MVQQNAAVPWWVYLVVLLGIFLSAAGAVIAMARPAMLVGPDAPIGATAHIFAGYFAARSLVLGGFLAVLVALRARRALGQLLAIVGFIQLVDGVIDCIEGRWPIVPGVAILGIVFLLSAARLVGHGFWSRDAWAD